MDDRRIEDALRQGPPDEPAYITSVGRGLTERDADRQLADRGSGPAAFEGRVEREVIQGRRNAAGERGVGGRLGWALPFAAVVTIALVGIAVRLDLHPGETPSPHPSDLLSRIAERGVVRIAVSNEAPQTPTSGNAYVGFDVDVAQAVATKLGVRAELQLMTPDEILLGTGTWELAFPSHTIPYAPIGALPGARYYDWPAWLVVDAGSPVATVAALGGSAICVVDGTPGASWLSGTQMLDTEYLLAPPIGTTAVQRPTNEACLTALAAGEVDAAVTATLLDIDLAGRGLRQVGEGAAIVHHRIVLIRDSAELGDPTTLQKAVETAISDVQSTGQLAELSRRAFGGEDLTGGSR